MPNLVISFLRSPLRKVTLRVGVSVPTFTGLVPMGSQPVECITTVGVAMLGMRGGVGVGAVVEGGVGRYVGHTVWVPFSYSISPSIEANALLPYDAPLAFPDLVVVELNISICPIENAALLPYDAPLAFPDLVEVEVNISSCPIEKSALPP